VDQQPTTKPQAIALANALLANGANIDLGLAQINSKNLQWLGLSVDEAFDPCSNLRAAATVLETGFRSSRAKGSQGQAALQMALSAYNTGNLSRGFENGYVQKVLNSAAHIVPDIEGTELLIPAATVKVKGSEAGSVEPSRPPSLDIFNSDQAARVNLFD
jgi:type IV secretion system protein VirB1